MRISWIPAASLLLALILTACAAGETGAPAEEYMPDAAGANTAVGIQLFCKKTAGKIFVNDGAGAF